MKKTLKIFTLAFICLCMAILFMPNQVSATEVTVNNEAELVSALADVNNTKITLGADFILNSMVVIDRAVTIDGANHVIKTASSVQKSFEIYNTADTQIDITFTNITINNSYAKGRCIDTRNDKINLTLDGVKLNTTSTDNNQALTLGGTDIDGLNVKMINSSATSAGTAGYGIITFVPAEFLIKDSFVTGYAALYVKPGSSGLKVDVINSTLEGKNNNTGSDDSFGTIVVDESNVTIKVSESSKIISTGNGEQTLIADRSTGEKGNKIDISSAIIDANGPFAYVVNTSTELSVGLGVTSNVDVSDYLPAGVVLEEVEPGKFVAAERTIKVEGLENVVDAKEAEEILLESFEKWEEENPEIAKEIANTNITISLSFDEVPGEKVNQIPLEALEDYKDTLNKKDANAEMTKNFIQVYVYISNDDGGTYLTKLVKPITLKMNVQKLDDVADEYERKYYAVRAYVANIDSEDEIKYDVLDAKLSKDGKTIEITMPDGTLSICAVAYSDVKEPIVTPPADDEDNTGDEPTVTPSEGESGAEGEAESQPAGDKEKTETPDVPGMGDTVVPYVVLAIVAIMGIAIVKKLNTSKRKH